MDHGWTNGNWVLLFMLGAPVSIMMWALAIGMLRALWEEDF